MTWYSEVLVMLYPYQIHLWYYFCVLELCVYGLHLLLYLQELLIVYVLLCVFILFRSVESYDLYHTIRFDIAIYPIASIG